MTWEMKECLSRFANRFGERAVMPGEVSQSNPGPSDESPYVPSLVLRTFRCRVCAFVATMSGYHNDAVMCLRQAFCHCSGFAEPVTLRELNG